MIILLFFITAVLYASIGFGGGSTYNALLILGHVEYGIIPIVALVCNIIVVSGNIMHFFNARYDTIKKTVPWIILSIPMAWLGGYIPISERVFTGVLGVVLLLSSVQMLWGDRLTRVQNHTPALSPHKHRFIPYITGGILGLIAGMTGIGGGIFLAPLMHMLKWDTPKSIAGTCSVFILVNSIAGLLGQLMKTTAEQTPLWNPLSPYLWLFPAVFIGGQLGARLGTQYLSERWIKIITGLLILYVAIRLLYTYIELLRLS